MGILRQLLFGKYLLITNTLSCGLMMATADIIQQRSEYCKKYYIHKNLKSSDYVITTPKQDKEIIENSNLPLYEHNYTRTKNMTIVGLLQGPFHHWFYMLLDNILPGKNVKSVVKKICLDQSIASPTCLVIFFAGLGILEHHKVEEICKELKVKFRKTWKVDCCFWPPTQFVNFLFVPLHYRVLYINAMTMLYDIFLSYMKYEAHFG